MTLALRLISRWAVVLVPLAVGCSSDYAEEPTFEVAGKITLDGKPMSNGTIIFVSQNHEGEEGVTGEIANGTYSVRVPAGKHTVQFSLQKEVPVPGGGGAETEPVETLPARYTDESEFVVDVSADKDKNQFDCQLSSR